MIPRTNEWPVLAFTTGLNVGSAGFGWIAAGTKSSEWDTAPGGIFGVDYGTALGPGGADTEIFLITTGGPPGARTFSLPDAVVSGLVDGWVYRFGVEVPALGPGLLPVVTIWCGKVVGATYPSAILTFVYSGVGTAWDVYVWNFTGLAWVQLGTWNLGTSFTITVVRPDGGTSYSAYVNNEYAGDGVEGNAGIGPAIQFTTAAAGADCRITSLLVAPEGLRPTANAGPDKVMALGRVLGFDGGASSDPDGGLLSYWWKLVRAPAGSTYLYEGASGAVGASSVTFVASGIVTPGAAVAGDILVLDGAEYEITTPIVAPDIVTVTRELPSGFSGPFQVVHQTLAVGAATRYFAVVPDEIGIYVARLEVTDEDGLVSAPDLAAANVVGSTVPMRVPLDMGFFWEYLADFWKAVENREWAVDVWVAFARICASYLQDLWNIDFDKSLATTQNAVMRRWLQYPPRLDVAADDVPVFVNRQAPMVGEVVRTKTQLETVVTAAPTDIRLRFYESTGTTSVTITVPAGTLYGDVPAFLTAAFAAQDRTGVLFEYRELEPAVTYPPPVGVTLAARYKLVCWSTPCYTDLSEISGLPLFYNNPRTNDFRGVHAVSHGTHHVAILDSVLDVDGVIAVGDILNLGGRSFKITSVSYTRPAVAPYTRYLEFGVEPELPASLTSSVDATTGFGTVDCLWAVPSYWRTQRTDWYAEGVTPGDILYVHRRAADDSTGPFTDIADRIHGAGANKFGIMGAWLFYTDYVYEPAYLRRCFYLPVDAAVLSVPTLQEAPEEPTWIMQEYLHFMPADRRLGRYLVLNHIAEPVDEIDPALLQRSVTDALFLPDVLWAEITHVDNRDTMEANFGRMVNAWVADYAQTDSNYLSIVTGLWLVYSQGPTPLNIERAVGIISGVPYAEVAGEILDIVVDFLPDQTFMLIRDTDNSSVVRSYVFPTGDGVAMNPATGVAYAIGDTVERFALLVDTQLYFDYIDDPSWWIGLRSAGAITEPEKVHEFGVFMDARYTRIGLVAHIINFVLDFKKTHTYPVFALLMRISTSVPVSDDVALGVTLTLKDHLWDHAAPPILDYPRLGSGIRAKTQSTSVRNDAVLFRMATPGATGDETAPNTPWTISFRAGTALGSSAAGHDLKLMFVRGTTTAGAVVAYWAGLGSPYNNLVAYLPTGSDGLGTLNEEYGPILANHRGEYQTHFDDIDIRPVDETTCFLQEVNNAPTTVLSGRFGFNVVVAPVTVSGSTYRICLQVAAGLYFHNGATPAVSDICPRAYWVEFRTAAGAYRCEGQIIGVDSPIAPPGFGAGAGLNWVDVQIDPALPAPVAGDTFVVFRGPPYTRIMDWIVEGPPVPGDIYLGGGVFDNLIMFAGGVGPTYQIQVAGAGGAPPRFFRAPALGFDPIRIGDDYIVYYDEFGSLLGMAEFVSIDASDLATVRVRPASNGAPVPGGYFVVIRRPVYTEMTPDFCRHLSAFGPKGDPLFLHQAVGL